MNKDLTRDEDSVPEVQQAAPSSLTRRAFLHTGILGLSGLALTSSSFGIMGRNDVEITYRTFNIPNLPRAWHGKTITFLSDIHSGPFMGLDELRNVVRIVNSLKSDIVVIPGDFVTSHVDEMPAFIEAMSELKAPHGVFGCTGNHDYYAGVDAVSRSVEQIDFRMLRNENTRLEIDGEPLFLIGVDDGDAHGIKDYVEGKRAVHIESSFAGIPSHAASILLCHKPYLFEEFAKTNVGLMLAGHTHGGQIVLARFGRSVLALSSLASQYVEGVYLPEESKSNMQMYVSRGIGVVGLPIRINCRPEITKITLSSQVV